MYPYLYQSENISIGSYGLMLAVAYLCGRYLFIRRLEQRIGKANNNELLIILLLVSGVIGAKLMYLLKNVSFATLTTDSAIDPSGFSSQGALLAAFLVLVFYAKFNQLKLATLLDAAAPAAILAYLIARIGCLLSGDDCWGTDSTLPWAMSFPDGIAPTTNGQSVHPVPLYEILSSLAILMFLNKYETRKCRNYEIFIWLLTLWGGARFLVEFVSNNPTKIYFMSGSQFGALLMLFVGSAILIYWNFILGKKKPGN
jgi:phosphatidylglycerol---prolipoprotein diacylglyceryl transferase